VGHFFDYRLGSVAGSLVILGITRVVVSPS
jgi:hypothetical protein